MPSTPIEKSPSSLWVNPTGGAIRVDAAGDGHYGTRRLRKGVSVAGGHRGIDLLCEPGQEVRSPFDASVLRDGRVYGDSAIYRLVVLRAVHLEGVEVKLMYVHPRADLIGRRVLLGELVAVAQDVRGRYPNANAMQPHVHVELRKNGIPMDPTPYFFA